MASLTTNEAKTIEFLIRNFYKDYNINQLARELNISVGGIFKILKKLKTWDFLIEKRLGNNVFYKINYDSQEALDACKFALTERKVDSYVKMWIKDLEILKKKTELAILFGSVLKRSRKARDIDILLVFKKRNLKDIEHMIDKINKIKSKKIHAVYQTKSDLIKNIKRRDKAILNEIREGVILWGRDFLVESVKNGQN